MAEPVARSVHEATLVSVVQRRSAEYSQLKTEGIRAKAAEDRIASKRANAEDYLILGEHLCFTKSMWERGLPLLAKSSDVTLKGLAEKELAIRARRRPNVNWRMAGGRWPIK